LERPEVALAAEFSFARGENPSASEEAEKHEMASLLKEALEALPPLQQKLLQLRAEEKDFKEAGEALGISSGAARAHASRAYKKLKEWMKSRMRN
jgi:RNA polymerase sigma factor (sigma-70 family)